MNRTHAALALAALTFTAAVGVLIAGPLNPPSGPVAPTYKTLSEVEPRIAINLTNTRGDADSLFKITQPGSYYLTGNITGEVGKHGIEIAAGGVTLDLSGFDLVGVPGMGGFDGVSVTVNNLSNIEVRNGTVRNWGDEGVDLGSFLARNNVISNVRTSGNAGNGISGGGGCVISGCVAYANTFGFVTFHDATVTACTAEDNVGNGYSLGNGSTISQCTAQSNSGNGIVTDTGCTIIGCTAASNSGSGIDVASGCTVSQCTAYLNGVHGVSASLGCDIVECSASSNNINGIDTINRCTVRECTVSTNTIGIKAGDACTITGNTAGDQSGDGIQVSDHCTISGNTCSFNGNGSIAAGIHATGDSNRVEANACNGNDFGIDIDGTGNIIIKNTCAGNTQAFVIVTDNLYGPIIDRRIPTTVPSTPAAIGFSATGTMGSTDTNANFAH